VDEVLTLTGTERVLLLSLLEKSNNPLHQGALSIGVSWLIVRTQCCRLEVTHFGSDLLENALYMNNAANSFYSSL
jgi:hypothetical protein